MVKALPVEHRRHRSIDKESERFLQVNVDKCPATAKQFNVGSVPTTLLVRAGLVAKRVLKANAVAVSKMVKRFVDASNHAVFTSACHDAL